MRAVLILIHVLLLAPGALSQRCCRPESEGGCPLTFDASPFDNQCSYCCGGVKPNAKTPNTDPTAFSCPSCGFNSFDQCFGNTTCRTVWAGIATNNPSVLSCGTETQPSAPYSQTNADWQKYFNSCQKEYCNKLGCYILG